MSEIESSYRVTGDELRKFIERIERLDAEKKRSYRTTKRSNV